MSRALFLRSDASPISSTEIFNLISGLTIVFIDEVEGIKRRITDEAGGRVCNPTLDPDTEAINDI